jgi:hypothetical protein
MIAMIQSQSNREMQVTYNVLVGNEYTSRVVYIARFWLACCGRIDLLFFGWLYKGANIVIHKFLQGSRNHK